MANTATLYRFKISVSDVDRAFYEDLDFRAAMHPSESEPFLLTRVLAYALNYESGLTFSAGISTPDEPAISLLGPNGIAKWIDIGNPSARRLHKAAKAAQSVRIYTYKDPEVLKREAASENIFHAEQIEIFSIDEKFIASLIGELKRDNTWSLIQNDGQLVLTVGDKALMTTLVPHRLATDKKENK